MAVASRRTSRNTTLWRGWLNKQRSLCGLVVPHNSDMEGRLSDGRKFKLFPKIITKRHKQVVQVGATSGCKLSADRDCHFSLRPGTQKLNI